MKRLTCNKTFDKKQIAKLVEWFTYNYGTIRTDKLINKLKSVGFKHSTHAGLSLGPDDLKIPSIKKELILNTTNYLIHKKKNYEAGKITKQNLLQKEINIWNLTNNTLKNEIIKNFRQTDLLNPVYMMIFSGARGNLAQIKQLIGMRGLMSDSKGEIINLPIKSSLKEGIKSKEYFISCYGARKGIIDTALKTANSGYLTRKLIYVAQNTIVKQQNCHTKKGIVIKLSAKSNSQYKELKAKITGTILAEDILDKKMDKKIISKGQDICPYIAKRLIQNETYIYTRSILTCRINIGICQLCYGWDLGTNKLVRIGEAIGILAAQSIGEPGTQLTMRTFHTGGVFTSKTNKVITSPHQGKIIYNDRIEGKKIKDKFNENIFLLLKRKDIYIKKDDRKISKISLPKHSLVFLKPGEKVFTKQVIGEITEWKKNKQGKKETSETKSENSGQTKFHESKGQKKKMWIVNGNIIDAKKFTKRLVQEQNCVLTISENSKLKINTKITNKKKKLTETNFNKSKSFKNRNKITRSNKLYEIIKVVEVQNKLMLTKKELKQRIKSEYNESKEVRNIGGFYHKVLRGLITEKKANNIKLMKGIPYLVPIESNLRVLNNELIEKGTTIFRNQYKKEKTKDIIEGLPKIEEILEAKKLKGPNENKENLHEKLEKIFQSNKKKYSVDLANRKSIEKIQKIIVNQIQKVYSSQDVNIAEKHIAVIVRQITSKVIIKQAGDSNIMEGELMDINKIEKVNKLLKNKASYEPILIGISKTSLLNEGFISAACFQETVRVLSRSAIKGKIDWLTGLKENIILGNLIPSGTGKSVARIGLGV